MTEMAPERPIPDEGEAYEVEATGSLADGVITIHLQLEDAEVVLRFNPDNDDSPVDTLIAAIPAASQQVLDALVAAQEADHG